VTVAAIFGLAGPHLSSEEAAFFRDVQPWGFILFGRNVESPGQLRALTSALRETVGRADAPILIDQEGGRVQRLRPPHWPTYPTGETYSRLRGAGLSQRDFAWLGGRLIAADLAEVGINVDCAPVADVPARGAHDVIGDRAFAQDVREVVSLARAMAEGLTAGGVLPIIKHIPGHGRARADSHKALPVVDATLADLEATDFAAFRGLADLPMAMTAHVVFTAVDPGLPATTSPIVIDRVIRKAIGFDGLLMSDDLSMNALSGDLRDRAAASLTAGCDVVLHCNGSMEEMTRVASATGALSGEAARRAKAALAALPANLAPFDRGAGRARLDLALADLAA